MLVFPLLHIGQLVARVLAYSHVVRTRAASIPCVDGAGLDLESPREIVDGQMRFRAFPPCLSFVVATRCVTSYVMMQVTRRREGVAQVSETEWSRVRLQLGDGARVEFAPHDVVALDGHALPRTMRVTLPGADDLPSLALTIEMRDGLPSCVGVELASDAGSRGIRATDLTRLPLDELIEQACALAGESMIVDDGALVLDGRPETAHERAERHDVVADTVRGMRAGSSTRITRDKLDAVAQTFREHEHTGRPVQHVMQRHGLGLRTANRWIARARAAGLLAPSRRTQQTERE